MVALVLVLAAGCAPDGSKPVADSTMVEVLIELHLLNARLEIEDRPLVGSRDSILQRYGLDSASYAAAMRYYADRPQEYAELYGRVVDEMAAERAPAFPPDSIRYRQAPRPPSP